MANSSLLKAVPSRALTKTVQSTLYPYRTPPLKIMRPSLVFHVDLRKGVWVVSFSHFPGGSDILLARMRTVKSTKCHFPDCSMFEYATVRFYFTSI